jgi:SAM-dependent methyltransferase
MKKVYDLNKKSIICYSDSPTPEMWDKQWGINSDKDLINLHNVSLNTFVSDITKRYINCNDGAILEGGCGLAQHVNSLFKNGYNVIGIDFANKTVQILNRLFPHLNIYQNDVRALNLADNSLIGYWSLGVIEHFENGYDDIASEMKRVIKPGGFLFITHPYISPLRKLKIFFKLYPTSVTHTTSGDFYQYILCKQSTISHFRSLGFELRLVKPIAGLKGFKDEVKIFNRFLQTLYNYRGSSLIIRSFIYSIDHLLNLISGHSCLIVLQKK